MVAIRFFFSFSLLFFLIPVKSQEFEIGLTSNPSLKRNKIVLKKASNDTLSLPFFDDFSGSDPYPNSINWADRNVFINSNFEFEPVSTGVATFDALDEAGNVYNLESLVSGADTLTSNPIDLSGKVDVYLSFFYQPEGLGDMPEAQDSLKLEFKNSNDSTWSSQFQVEGTSLQPFKQIILPVDGEYLYNGFQFRFINKVSLTIDNDFAGYGASADHWNLDYVYLNQNRTTYDTTYHDVTITTPVPDIFNNYESIPWSHFTIARVNEQVGQIPINIRNLNQEENEELQINVFYYLQDIKNPEYTDEEQYFWFNLAPNTEEIIDGDLTFDFTSSPTPPSTNNAEFLMRINLKDDTEELNERRENDTVSKIIKFKDYYAYDDGSPEAGYGFKGIGSENSMFALKFNTYKRDTLKNIYMYFNPTSDDSAHNDIRFKITVWNSIDNEPGQIIYDKTVNVFVNPHSKEFERYEIDEELVLEGDFYIGWQQLKKNYLNIGLDKNNSTRGKAMINTNGYWSTSSIDGAAMLRPGFGTRVVSSVDNNIKNDSFLKLYPNPAINKINIEFENNYFSRDYSVEILDLSGRIMILENLQDSNTVDISNLKTGIYLVILKNKTNILAKQKLLVQ